MTDIEYSDDERYANESFENESDTEVPEMSEFESETTSNSDNEEDDEDELPSVKLNTGPIRRSSFSHNLTSIHKTDAIPFASSSDEEDDVIVGETLAEINTPSMHFENESPKPSIRQTIPTPNNRHLKSVEEETQESSEEEEEISEEEEDDEDEEFKRIKDMEEKYIQLNSGKISNKTDKSLQEFEKHENDSELMNQKGNEKNSEESESDNETEDEEQEQEQETGNSQGNVENSSEEMHSNDDNVSENNCQLNDIKAMKTERSLETLDQNNLMEILQNSLNDLKISPSENSCDNIIMNAAKSILANESETLDIKNLNPETIALALVNAIKNSNLIKQKQKSSNEMTIQEIEEDDDNNDNHDHETSSNLNQNESNEDKEIEIVHYQDDYEQEEELELESKEHGNTDHLAESGSVDYDDDREIYYDAHFDYRITSKTPSSFNSDEYIFHANFIKQFHRTGSTDKLRVKPHPRKSMSFSNERMREIERHNQILLRKILTQKPTYTLKSKSSTTSMQKVPSQTNTRLTTSAVNRKKQQRQIDLDNQVLKKKIEAIAMRRRPLIKS